MTMTMTITNKDITLSKHMRGYLNKHKGLTAKFKHNAALSSITFIKSPEDLPVTSFQAFSWSRSIEGTEFWMDHQTAFLDYRYSKIKDE